MGRTSPFHFTNFERASTNERSPTTTEQFGRTSKFTLTNVQPFWTNVQRLRESAEVPKTHCFSNGDPCSSN
ncbi:hypothetical protein VIGAN_01473000 [Vigna angularis var. angularis]|uniref:Uncharacterized protein n=1 Tax=Vigna angularis var. angularis TaxID=157739 RepID=A0A0S3R841_PHAAN|nr:hypothetical protein VIGAN_01473000 [Vigna angularis var. angularis]